MMVGVLTSAIYFISRDLDRLNARVSDLEDDSLVFEDDEEFDDEEEQEPETETEDAKKQE
jgi:hypothetical protein